MGLDCCFVDQNGKLDKELEQEFSSLANVSKGLFANENSFRGKQYAEWFMTWLNVDLYENKTPKEVEDISIQLNLIVDNGSETEIIAFGQGHNPLALAEIAKIFARNAEKGNKMVAWS